MPFHLHCHLRYWGYNCRKIRQIGYFKSARSSISSASCYEDRTSITPIIDLRPEQYATIEGVVQSTEVQFGRRPMLMTYLSDGSAKLALRFFNFNAGMKTVYNWGKVKAFGEVRRAFYGRNAPS